MDKLTPDELRILKLGVDSRLADDDDDPALHAALHEAIAYANVHPEESKINRRGSRAHSKMDFRVEIADPAIDDLAGIVSYIAQDNPKAASALGNHLLDAALSLAQTPHKGSPYRHIGNLP